MPQNDVLAALPIRLPKSEKAWANFIKSLANIDIRSGATAFNEGTGYFLGWHEGVPVFFIGNSDGSNMRWDGQSLFLDKSTIIIDGEELRTLAYGIQTGTAADAEAVTFSPEFSSVPAVIFGDGGLTYSNTLGAVDQTRIIQAVNLTTTGFTMKAKLSTLGALTPRSDSFSAVYGTSDTATKALATEAWDDQYTCTGTLRIPNQSPLGVVTVGLYTKPNGGSYTLRYSTVGYGDDSPPLTFTEVPLSTTVTVDGLDAGSVYKWEIINDSNGGASVKGATATYDESSTTETSATPTGATEISWLAIGGT